MSVLAQATDPVATPNGRRDSIHTPAAEGLLEARQLLLAIAGQLEGGSGLIEWARELADLHATGITAMISPLRRPADFDAAAMHVRIRAVIGLIDDWSIFHLPRPTAARRHTHSLGEVISHVAETYAQVQWTLRHSDSAEHRHEAAVRFAQVQQGYADLIGEIKAMRVELALGWRGPRPIA
ncbi:hypothetical protein [Nocardia noduli]|uniref:hypothetical protein n=1 Tax=Nocardia noduli TaxID=2815722 RepID=UPI001C235C9A|nr:hypothetical protein [Nocardia noduli]